MRAQKERTEKEKEIREYNRGIWIRRLITALPCACLVAAGVFLLLRVASNARFARAYDAGVYEADIPESLLRYNYMESFVAVYNRGAVAMQKEKYREAEALFSEALKMHPSHTDGDVCCDIRVNYALSIVRQIEFDKIKTLSDIERAKEKLQRARDILTEDGCANPEKGVYDGHDTDAEQLKKEIDEAMDELEKMEENADPSPDGEENTNNGGGQKPSGQPDSGQDNLRDELREDQRNSMRRARRGEQSGGGYGTSGAGADYYW